MGKIGLGRGADAAIDGPVSARHLATTTGTATHLLDVPIMPFWDRQQSADLCAKEQPIILRPDDQMLQRQIVRRDCMSTST